MLWEHLQQRHDCLELTLVCLNNITDTEFRLLVEKDIFLKLMPKPCG